MDMEDDILIQKYETSLYNRELIYLDSDEFEVIIDHYMQKDRYADALEASIHAELCHPDDVSLSLCKIRAMMSLDNYDRAFELLEYLEKNHNDIYELNLYKGQIYAIGGEVDNAVREFEIVCNKNPSLDVETQVYISDVLIEQRYYEEALSFLLKFVELGTVDARIYFNTGYCYEQIPNVKKAEKYYEKSLDEDPFNEKTWIILGALHLNTFNIDKALEAFEFALSINNNSHIAALCKTATLIKSGDYNKAIDCIMDILANAPGNVDALCSLGECYEMQDDFDEAEECYTQAIYNEKNSDVPYWGLSRVLYAQGDVEMAIQIIDKAIALDPNNEEYLFFRGQCFVSLSRNMEKLNNVLRNPNIIRATKSWLHKIPGYMNKYKKAVFLYSAGNVEDCCTYLLDAVLMHSECLVWFFNLFPEAKKNAYLVNYFGKYLK
ncbi:MAG: tetratricopeptide repeat protein [Prevotellaceae bacterium]|jgi:tetratricopeptide (TPR) repeat protein|nr:tetratricopeptide repeat protein [Prevotellaceae bacterium]